jgi:hypothetical protein
MQTSIVPGQRTFAKPTLAMISAVVVPMVSSMSSASYAAGFHT